MTIRIGINGFGRIGRAIFRAALSDPAFQDLQVVAINDLSTPEILTHLFRFDSFIGPWKGECSLHGATLTLNTHACQFLSEPLPAAIPWHRYGVDVVIEATGRFANLADASSHLRGGARRVIISAPAKGEVKTVVMGINEDEYDPDRDRVVSNASCTTNCLAHPARLILDHFGIKRGLLTTIHSYTADQRLLDAPHNDLRRARSAATSIIPTTTGAAAAIGLVIPELSGRFDGMSVRVPVANVSLVDMVVEVEKSTNTDTLNEILQAAQTRYMGFSNLPLVSSDYREESRSGVVDGLSTRVIDTTVKILIWYNNEWAYAHRVLDLIHHMHALEI